MPISLGIEPTTACNLRCPQCICGQRAFTRPTGRMPLTNFKQIIDEVKTELIYLILYFQGEPYLNPEFLDMVAYANQAGIFTMTSTNGHFLTPTLAEQTVQSGLGKLIISLDGTTQASYEKYRIGGKYETVIQGIKNLVAAKKKLGSRKPFIELQFIVFAHNEHEIAEVKALSKTLQVNHLSLKTAQVYDYNENGAALIPINETYRRYKQDSDGNFIPMHKVPNRCKKLWQGAEISWDGRVLPCCFDKDAQHELGKLNDTDNLSSTTRAQSFYTIWRKSTQYRAFRKQILQNRAATEMCRNCTEGVRVKI